MPDADAVPEPGDEPARAKPKQPSSKTKDLSHVPCKFYRVGSCTAGLACPFSHAPPPSRNPQDSTNPQPKDVCAWFVKGTCKFGHKCALAHVLPGQSMAMDRKNKKAAQVAAAGAAGGKAKANKPRDNHGATGTTGGTTSAPRNPLLSGSTAPTRAVHPSPPTPHPPPPPSDSPPSTRLQLMPTLKASISPSAPAPPLKDTDFPAFTEDGKPPHDEVVPSEPTSLPTAAPRRTHPHQTRPSHDFGPIGSPPRSSPHHLSLNGFSSSSPGTSPPLSHGGQPLFGVGGGTTPFSAPNQPTQSVFLHPSSTPPPSAQGIDFTNRRPSSGMAASLGTAHLSALSGGRTRSASGAGWSTDLGPVPSQVLSVSHARTSSLFDRERERDAAVEDEDLEEFIPGSLSDLLSPSERSRRMSRTNSSQQPQAFQSGGGIGLQRPALSAHNSGFGIGMGNGNGSRHHHSRSVPAPSLLGDIKSIWAPNDPSFPPTNSPSHLPIGSGTPSSFKSNFGGRSPFTSNSTGGEGLSQSYTDRDSSLSMLSPTNASAAFLGGLHHHFLNRSSNSSGGVGVQRSVSGERSGGAGGGLQAHSNFSAGGMNGGMGMAFSPPRLNAFGSRPPFSTHDSSHSNIQPLSQDLSLNGTSPSSQAYARQPPSDIAYHPHLNSNNNNNTSITNNTSHANNNNPHLNPQTALSPSTRALQSHAPGQSLPQGLAAGYSRIHALPPPPNMGSSPSFSGVGSMGSAAAAGGSPNTGGLEWAKVSDSGVGGGGNGLESMLSRLSYSAATSRPTQASALSMTSGGAAPTNSNTTTTTTPPPPPPPSTMTRNPSGGKPWQPGSSSSGGPLSPLSGPVLTGDDDDLFSMDG